MDLDSKSDFFYSIRNNHSTNNKPFLEKNEFLRENLSRPTNDVSDFPPFYENSPFENAFNEIPLNHKPSDQIDWDIISFNDQYDQNSQDNLNKEEIKINELSNNNLSNNTFENIPKSEPESKPEQKPKPEQKSKSELKPKKNSNLFQVKKDKTKDLTSELTFLSHIALIFILFEGKKPAGRTPNFYKNNANYNHNPKHSKDHLDNFKAKVIRRCFKEISDLIFSICKSFGPQYRIKKLNKKDGVSSIQSIVLLCQKRMVDLFINNNPRNIKHNSPNLNFNSRIYDRLMLDGKLNQSPLLMNIFDMTFGEILFKFINDDNFAKKIDPNYNFTTFSEIFGKMYSDELNESLQQNLRKLLNDFIV